VHAGIKSEKEKERNLIVPDDPTAKLKVNYDGKKITPIFVTLTETSSVKKASFVTRFITTHKGSVRTAKFTRDGKYVVTGSADSSLKLLDVEKMHYHHQTKGEVEEYTQARPVIRTFYDHTGVRTFLTTSNIDQEINDVDFHPTMPIVASAARDNTVRFFDYTKASIKRSFHTIGVTECEPRSINIHPSGDFILIGTSTTQDRGGGRPQAVMRLVDLHSMKTFTSQNSSDHHLGDINMVKWSNNGKLWVSGAKDGCIKLWDGRNGRCVNTIPNAHTGHVYSVQFSHNNNYLLSNGQDSVVKLWDLSTGRQIRTFKGPSAQPSTTRHNCCFSYNEHAVLSSRENEVLIWDTITGELVHRLNGHNKVIRWISFSPTEQSFVSCSDDQRARFWADETWEQENGFI
jgi:cleavage stimulation factor subunit 1